MPALLKTPFARRASPCRSYRPPAKLLKVPSGPKKRPRLASRFKSPVPEFVTVPTLLNKPLKNFVVAAGQGHRAGVGETSRTAGDDAARPLEKPGWKVEGGPRGPHLQNAGADADDSGPGASVGAAVADGSSAAGQVQHGARGHGEDTAGAEPADHAS